MSVIMAGYDPKRAALLRARVIAPPAARPPVTTAGVARSLTCGSCGRSFTGRRATRRTCSARCQQDLRVASGGKSDADYRKKSMGRTP